VTVDQAGKQRGRAQINSAGACRMCLQLRRRPKFFDLAGFDEHRRGSEHMSGSGIEQAAGFHERHPGRRLRDRTCGRRQEDTECEYSQEACTHAPWMLETRRSIGNALDTRCGAGVISCAVLVISCTR
jgi:hypothetical protein